jgi:hypothetical protein
VVGFLSVAAAYAPVRVFAVNVEKFPHLERILLVWAGLLVLGVFWYACFRLLRFDSNASLAAAFAFVVLLSIGGGLAARVTTVAALGVVIGGSIVVSLLSNRMGPKFAHSLVALASIFFGLSIALTALLDVVGEQGVSRVEPPTSSLPEALAARPDVYLILLDGFPGEIALREVYHSDLELPGIPGVDRIEAWATYPMTIASIASLVQMGYPLSDGDVVDNESVGDLSRIMAGENRFAELLADEGYHATLVESGYSNSYCAASVDVCVESAFLDEGIFGILDQTILRRELRKRKGSAFTENGLHAMAWLRENLPRLGENDRPDYVYANVALPHPPMMLDENCDVTYEYWRTGNSVYAGDTILRERQKAYLEQTQCVVNFEEELFGMVPDDAVTIFFSDHGGDSLGQMSRYDHVWSQEDVVERMNTHLAIRMSEPCDFDPPVLLSEMLHDLLWCLSGEEPRGDPEDARIHTASRILDTSFYRLNQVAEDALASLDVAFP